MRGCILDWLHHTRVRFGPALSRRSDLDKARKGQMIHDRGAVS
jgi:hypothetical protein